MVGNKSLFSLLLTTIMKQISLVFCSLLFSQTALSFAGPSEISTALERMAVKLSDSYNKGAGPGTKAKIAVFKFSSDRNLEKKRVGFAVSELLTHHLVGKAEFAVVERLEMAKVFDELKFSLSGAVDPDNALKVGKILGADVLVLGSVEKLSSKYHINARLVKAETGEVLAAAYEALSTAYFEEAAKEYLFLVPQIQRIGFYALYNWRNNRNDLPEYTEDVGGGQTAEFTTKPFKMGMSGGGIRYFPAEKVVVDLAIMTTTKHPETARFSGGIFSETVKITTKNTRILLSGKIDVSDVCSLYIGGGISKYSFNNYSTPAVQTRLEYYPQKRIGLSVSANYDVLNEARRYPNPQVPEFPNALNLPAHPKVTILDKFYVEPSISLYF